MDVPAVTRRTYRQSARAEAAEATGRRILDAFQDALRDQWLEDVTLDRVAAAAGVTVQTVIRRFGGKEGLLRAVRGHMQQQVLGRRENPVGDVDRAVANICADYEASGDMLVRLLAQEDRYPDLKPLLDFGRDRHRAWVEAIAAPWLERLTAQDRLAAVDALVAAMDVYVWKLVRRDMDRSAAEAEAIIRRLVAGALRQLTTEIPSLHGGDAS